MFDLATLDTSTKAAAGVPMQVRHPTTRQPLDGVTISYVGSDSARYRDKLREVLSRRLESQEPTTAQIDDENAELYGACATGWTGIVLDGSEVPFSEANAVALHRRLAWLREQADRHIRNRDNFFPDGSANSSSTPSDNLS